MKKSRIGVMLIVAAMIIMTLAACGSTDAEDTASNKIAEQTYENQDETVPDENTNGQLDGTQPEPTHLKYYQKMTIIP